MTATTFIDSTAIALLVAARARGASLTIRGEYGAGRTALEMSGLLDWFVASE